MNTLVKHTVGCSRRTRQARRAPLLMSSRKMAVAVNVPPSTFRLHLANGTVLPDFQSQREVLFHPARESEIAASLQALSVCPEIFA